MYVSYDPDEYEIVSEHQTCAFHEANPGVPFAGCCCSSSFTQRRRSDAEIAAIKAKKVREAEDRILAQAEIIKARRRRQEEAA
jgi:hypothetical protein